jgi:K+-transporting ATPase ATPase A chain
VLHTAISFITNTNQQHYTGETGLSYLSQMAAIPFLMFTAAASGLSVGIAFIRGLTGRSLGNFWADMVHSIVRVLLPGAIILALLYVWQGVPQTLAGPVTAQGLEGGAQVIYRGPVASLEAIKHLGTNGGGFFGANSAHPFENPTPLTNLLQMLSFLIIPGALIYLFGLFANNKRLGWILYGAAASVFVVTAALAIWAESRGNPALHALGLPGPNWEGKEVRFGPALSALYAAATTAAANGAVNAMHDALTPLGTFVPLLLMMLNSIFGGEGVGVINLLVMVVLTVFLVGLMVGRTPAFLGRKLESKEIGLLAVIILIHPLLILGPSAFALLASAGRAAITHEGFRGMTQVLYEYTSAAANNGSGMEGLLDGTPFWNWTTGIVMLIGRYASIILALVVAAILGAKRPAPAGPGTLRIDTLLFGAVLVGVILIVGALTFFPALALGPVAEHLRLFGGR